MPDDAPHDAAAAEGPVVGPEMDCLIAEKIFGLTRHPSMGTVGGAPVFWNESEGLPSWRTCPSYSTAIAAAWTVVTRLRELMVFGLENSEQTRGIWRCTFGVWTVYADTAPLAICRAALAACRALQGGAGPAGGDCCACRRPSGKGEGEDRRPCDCECHEVD